MDQCFAMLECLYIGSQLKEEYALQLLYCKFKIPFSKFLIRGLRELWPFFLNNCFQSRLLGRKSDTDIYQTNVKIERGFTETG